MIIHVLMILFVVVFWSQSVSIACYGKSIVLPLSVVALIYIASIYFCFKVFFFARSFTSKFLDAKNKQELAKNKLIEAVLSCSAGNNSAATELWQESKKYLSEDKLFILLSLMNSKLAGKSCEEAAMKLGSTGMIIRKHYDKQSSYTKSDLQALLSNYKLPWLYEDLIKINLESGEIEEADKLLKNFWATKKLSLKKWQELKSKIYYTQALLEKSETEKYKLLKKANRLDPTSAVFELAIFYKTNKDIAKARKIIEEAWKTKPSIKLGRLYVELDEFDLIPIHKFQHARQLSQYNENHPISHILIATYALSSELWGIGKQFLDKFKVEYPELGEILLARLESEKTGSYTKVWENMEKVFVMIAKKQNLDVEGIL